MAKKPMTTEQEKAFAELQKSLAASQFWVGVVVFFGVIQLLLCVWEAF